MLEDYSAPQLFLLFTFTTALIPVGVGLLVWKRLKERYRSIFFLALATLVVDGLASFLWLNKTNNLFLTHIHTLAEFLLIANVYRLNFKGFLKTNIVFWTMVGFVCLSLLNTFFIQGIMINNSYMMVVESLVLITLALVNFYQFSHELKIERLGHDPMFWFSSGVLIYFSSNIFIFIFSNYVLTYSKELDIRMWAIHSVFYIFFEIICAITLWLGRKKLNSFG